MTQPLVQFYCTHPDTGWARLIPPTRLEETLQRFVPLGGITCEKCYIVPVKS